MNTASEGEMRRVRISDGYNMTSKCLMNQDLSVRFLQNPIIRVLKWRMINHNTTKCLHITEFITVKNTVDFPLLGNPRNLSNTAGPEEAPGDLTTVGKVGVLRPGRDLNNLVSNIMTAMTQHYINGSAKVPIRSTSNRIYIQKIC